MLAAFLAGCASPLLPFEKDLPAQSSIVNPPWEALVKAGPGADNELDFETLDGPSAVQPPPLLADAEAAGQAEDLPKPATTQKAAKKGVVIKAVAVPLVVGAEGKGNRELTQAMRQVLRDAGWPVVDAPAANALTIRGRVKMATAIGPTQNITLQWVVTSPDGKSLGDVTQANDVAAGSLSKGWGENAGFATEAAAEGLFKLIQKYR